MAAIGHLLLKPDALTALARERGVPTVVRAVVL